MRTDNYNLNENQKRLIIKALNNFPTKIEAAKKLGIVERSLYNYIDKHNIVLNEKTGKYYTPKKRNYLIAA